MNNRLPVHCSNKPVSIVKGSVNHPRSHNLNVSAYTFEELLNIFGLPFDMTIEDMKRAKKQVLMVHPDKSQLPSDYFMFYRNAYEIILRHFESTRKMQQSQSEIQKQMESQTYQMDQEFHPSMSKVAKNLDMNKFNQLFEENVYIQPKKEKNAWFSGESSTLNVNVQNVSAKNMSSAFESIRTDPRNSTILSKYSGVQEMQYGMGSQFYQGDEDDDVDNAYVSSDPFSKLKFDDLRKVHRDQTIFSVSESDYSRMNRAETINEFQSSRNSMDISPLEKQKAEALLRQQQLEYEQRMAKKQHADTLYNTQMENKMKRVEAYFLQLENGKR